MKKTTRKKTISVLLSASLLLSSALNIEAIDPFILPDEISIESLLELKEKNGKKKRLLNKNMC